jgi:AcrR family transcriptional regulator
MSSEARTRTRHTVEVRREMILQAATKLFAERGFHNTGIDDVGAEAGVTGPAVYRYFPGKYELLAAVLERAVNSSYEDTVRTLGAASTPEDALERLLASAADAVVQNRNLTALSVEELRNLPEDRRFRVARLERLLLEEWVHVVNAVRPDLSDGEARFVVRSVVGVVTSLAQHPGEFSRGRLHGLVTAMLRATVRASLPAP